MEKKGAISFPERNRAPQNSARKKYRTNLSEPFSSKFPPFIKL
jgi:hypothetical protein